MEPLCAEHPSQYNGGPVLLSTQSGNHWPSGSVAGPQPSTKAPELGWLASLPLQFHPLFCLMSTCSSHASLLTFPQVCRDVHASMPFPELFPQPGMLFLLPSKDQLKWLLLWKRFPKASNQSSLLPPSNQPCTQHLPGVQHVSQCILTNIYFMCQPLLQAVNFSKDRLCFLYYRINVKHRAWCTISICLLNFLLSSTLCFFLCFK